jgi:dTDP-glucose 4,6-dehydratase
LEVIGMILDILHLDKSLVQFVADRPGHDRRYAIDWSKAQRELQWEPQISLEAGLRKTVTWYVEHQDWWQRVKSGAYQEYYQRQYGDQSSQIG